jgi:hypothetical protein
MQLELANGKKVEVSQEEIDAYITQELIPNPYWIYSGLLTTEEVMRFLQKESTEDELRKIARYLLVFIENLSFTGYLFDRSAGQLGMTTELNMPVGAEVREMYKRIESSDRTFEELSGDAYEIVNKLRSIGVDGL